MTAQASPAALRQDTASFLSTITANTELSLRTLFPCLLVATVFLLGPSLIRRKRLAAFPDVTAKPSSPFDVLNVEARMAFVGNAKEIIRAGFEKAGKHQIFRLVADVGEMLVLPPEYANITRNMKELNFSAFVSSQFHTDIPGFETFRQSTGASHVSVDMIRSKLTPALNKVTEPLVEEAAASANDFIGNSDEWKPFMLKKTLLDVVARMSAKVFLGDEGCRNEDWLRLTKELTVDLFHAAVKLAGIPPGIRHIVHWFLPECKALREDMRIGREIINKMLSKRHEEKKRLRAEGIEPEFNDALEWYEIQAHANGVKLDYGVAQLFLALAAIHTTTDLINQTMIQILLHPEIIKPLREEIIQVVAEQGGWKKQTLYNLKLMDSVIKESQRLKPITIITMARVATTDIVLDEGKTFIPKGTKLGVSSHGMWDPSVHADPETWDGYRFLRMREQPGMENKGQLATTSVEHIAFGHGTHACPGRFFAANEIKIALVVLLMRYDWQLKEGTPTEPISAGQNTDSNPHTEVLVKRRACELSFEF